MMQGRRDGLVNPLDGVGIDEEDAVEAPPSRPIMISYTPPPTVPAPIIPIRMGLRDDRDAMFECTGR